MVLHELAHGYHHRVLEGGFDNAEVKAAFDRAAEGGLYRSVLRLNAQIRMLGLSLEATTWESGVVPNCCTSPALVTTVNESGPLRFAVLP